MARVIVSSGHSPANPGSIANGLREVDVARQIAKAVLRFLRANGIISLSMPPGMELAQRIDWINRTGYTIQSNDIAIEIHVNDGGKSGFEAWFAGEGGNTSQQLTELIINSACAETKLPNQGAKSEFRHELGSIAFVHEVQVITSLIECCYIDNPADAEFLKNPTNIDLIAKGITKGICTFFNLAYKEVPVTVPTAVPNLNVANNLPRQIKSPVSPPVLQSRPQQISTQSSQGQSLQTDTTYQQQPSPRSDSHIQQPAPQVTTAFNNNGGLQQPSPSTSAAQLQSQPQSQAMQQPMQPATTGGFQPLPSREERKAMIDRTYQRIMGHSPNQNDLNYFLNIGIREEELIRKMVDSQEHMDLVKTKETFEIIQREHKEQKNELMFLRGAVEDQRRVIEGLNYSIVQKNNALFSFQQAYQQMQASAQAPKTSGKKPVKKPLAYKGTLLDRLFKAFSDLFE